MSAWLPRLEPQTEHLPMYERLLRSLLSDISEGALADGSPLPPQRKLASSLGLSVGTVTRFYREAESLGVIAGHVGRGTRVTRPGDEPAASSQVRFGLGIDTPGFEPAMANLAHNEPSRDVSMRAIEACCSDPEFLRSVSEEVGYASPAGYASHRQLYAGWLGLNGLEVAWRDLLVCPGAHHALRLAIRATRRPGEAILVDNNTYVGLLALARSHGLNIIPIGMDRDGALPDQLEAAAVAHPGAVYYTMPSLHNPTTRTTPIERRRDIVSVARKHGLRLLEDDVYRALAPSPPPAYFELAPELTLYVNSLSKVIAPTINTGCLVVSDKKLFGDVMRIAHAESLSSTSVATTLGALMLKNGTAASTRDRLAADIASRLDVVHEVFGDDVRHEWSPGAHHVWLPMPLADAERVTVDAMQSSIALTPPSSSSLVDADSGLRICIGACDHRSLGATLSTLKTLLY